jgi:murein DD-endopeptidase MepM/ murein hydrolase activator NlpD
MRRFAPASRGALVTASLVVALGLLALPAAAAAQSGGAAAPEASGGAAFGVTAPPPRLVARAFALTPATVRPGTTLTVALRIDGPGREARMRVDLVRRGSSRSAATLRLGRRPVNRALRVRWTPRLAPGTYTARLRASTVKLRRHAQVTASAPALEVTAPVKAKPKPAPAPTPAPTPPATSSRGVFPVQGAYTFGGPDARFGAARTGHVHQGQDLVADAGVPVVSPRAGVIHWVAYQAAGAGHYVIVRGDDGRDYAFMHLQDGSITVVKGQSVAAGQRLGLVGSTGVSSGPHLHFEIWPDGWWADGSSPIDPLPDLLAWAAG